ncbi:MAG: metallophosphoesterase [Sphingomonadaceae bacterium]|nr:metallophosphoesterase [Sphingomonadaceae bacterium]
MFGRMWRAIALVIAAWAIAGVGATPGLAQRPPRIVAIGDLHGDYAAYRAIVRAAGLIDDSDRWTGGEAVLVQTGDVPDRGADTLSIIRHLMRLQREALQVGGQVVALVGNHEMMNVTGDLRYVHPDEFAAFADGSSVRRRRRAYQANHAAIEQSYRARGRAMSGHAIHRAWLEDTPLGKVEHRAAWAPEGEIGRWVVSNPAVALIDGTLFAHGGISAAYAAMPIDEINRRVAAEIAARSDAPDAIIHDSAGPLWYRGLVNRESGEGDRAPPQMSVEEELDAVLRAHGARRIVVGHTPVPEGIAIRHDGRLIAIDTGISAHYGGARSYLEIIGDRVVAHVVSGEDGQ